MLAIETNLIVRYLTGDHPSNNLRSKSAESTAMTCLSAPPFCWKPSGFCAASIILPLPGLRRRLLPLADYRA